MGEIKHGLDVPCGKLDGPGVLSEEALHERILLIKQQHWNDGLSGEEWTRERFYRLCRLLHCQPEEIAEQYFIPRGALTSWLRKDSIPAYVSLHLIWLERTYFLTTSDLKIKPLPSAAKHAT